MRQDHKEEQQLVVEKIKVLVDLRGQKEIKMLVMVLLGKIQIYRSKISLKLIRCNWIKL